jgi:hypothetical protein
MTRIGAVLKEIQDRVSKNKNKPYQMVVVDTPEGDLRLFDWNGTARKAGVVEGDYCELNYVEGEFPKLNSMTKAEHPVITKQSEVGTYNVEPPKPTPQRYSPASSREYLAGRLACDLVNCEQVAVDKKIQRWAEAYEFIYCKIWGDPCPGFETRKEKG